MFNTSPVGWTNQNQNPQSRHPVAAASCLEGGGPFSSVKDAADLGSRPAVAAKSLWRRRRLWML